MNRVLFPMYLTKWNAGFYANQLQIATGLHFLKKENTNTKIMVSVGCSRTVLKLLVTIKICIDQWQVIRTVLMDGVSNRYLHQWMVQKRNFQYIKYRYETFTIISGADYVNINKACLPYYTDIHSGWSQVTFEFCVQKCKESDLCMFANWKNENGVCQLSQANCILQDTTPTNGIDSIWKKSRFQNFNSYIGFYVCPN